MKKLGLISLLTLCPTLSSRITVLFRELTMINRPLTNTFFSLLIFLTPLSVNAIDLQREATIQRLTTSLENQNYERAYTILQSLRQSGVEIKGELLYYESLAALSTKRDFKAFNLAEQYVEESGREAKYYSSALEIYSAAGENIDRQLIINSIEYFSKASVEMYLENRKTSLFNDFYEALSIGYEAMSASNKDNGDGTISIYRAVENDSGSYDLYKWDMFACPLGQTYRDGSCHGEIREFQQVGKASAKPIVENMSFAGHSDWQIPRPPSGLFLTGPIVSHFKGQRYEGPNSTSLVQGYFFNIDPKTLEAAKRMRLDVFENNTTPYSIPYHPYIFQSGSHDYCRYIVQPDVDCETMRYSVIPKRGPELIKSNLQPQCHDPHFSTDQTTHYYVGKNVCLEHQGVNTWFQVQTKTFFCRDPNICEKPLVMTSQ